MEFGKGEDEDRYWFKSIKTKQRNVYAYVVDPYFNLIGIATYTGQYQDGVKQAAKVAGSATPFVRYEALGAGWELVDRSKFVILTILSKNNDPRGKSWLRAAYNAWYAKMSVMPDLLRFWKRFGSPIMDFETAPNAADEFPFDPLTGARDTTSSKITPQQAAMYVLGRLRNGDSIARPHGSQFKLLHSPNDGGSLMAAMAWCDAQINLSITFQKLSNSTERNMSRNASEVHQDTLGHPVLYLKGLVADMLDRDVVRPWVRDNFGPEYLHLCPEISLGKINPEDFATILTAVGRAMAGGAIHYSQLPEIWDELDMPPADIKKWMEEIAEDREAIRVSATVDSTAKAEPTATGTDPKKPAAKPTGTAKPGKTSDLKRYVQQETGKSLTRSIARRRLGRQAASFSEEDEPGAVETDEETPDE
jgi:hypothetical protein